MRFMKGKIKQVLIMFMVIVLVFTSIIVLSNEVQAANSIISQTTHQKSTDSADNTEETDTQEYRHKAEESLNSWYYPSLALFEAEYLAIYRKAEDYYIEGRQFENREQYGKAKAAYQESWMILENNKSNLDKIEAILKDIRSNPNGDYDNDGLLNGYEIDAFYGYLNPMEADSDDNGIFDGEDDYDIDGLSNLDEKKYGTSPVNADTDDDKINDKREIELGFDPLIAENEQAFVNQINETENTANMDWIDLYYYSEITSFPFAEVLLSKTQGCVVLVIGHALMTLIHILR